MSHGKIWKVERTVKQLLRRLEYVSNKPKLWALETKPERPRRLALYERVRFKHWLYWKYGAECAYCGMVLPVYALTIDHIQPVSKGGNMRDIRNMALACLGCNQVKGDQWENLTPANIAVKGLTLQK